MSWDKFETEKPWMWSEKLYITPRFYILLSLVIVFLLLSIIIK